jgi:(p)ppGpp synthase/HD superfamily hydrolase
MNSQTAARTTTPPTAGVPLKDMDSALLTVTLLHDASTLGLREEMESAISFAAYFHSGQTRMNRANLPRTPYIEHPLRNTIRLIRWGVTERDILLASVFHDVPEDAAALVVAHANVDDAGDPTEAALRWVGAMYGAGVESIVRAVTNPPRNPGRPEQMRADYLQHIRAHVLGNVEPLLVKASDLSDNAGSLHHHLPTARPESLRRRAEKYLPVLGEVRAALLTAFASGQLTSAVASSAIRAIGSAVVSSNRVIEATAPAAIS